MSYAGPTARPSSGRGGTGRRPRAGAAQTSGVDAHDGAHPVLLVFGAGLLLGLLAGAGAALLAAPRSGRELREALRYRTRSAQRSLRRRRQDIWDVVLDELRRRERRGRLERHGLSESVSPPEE